MLTLIVEVEGGVVQHVYSDDFLPLPITVRVRDYDNLKVDPGSEDATFTLK